MSRRRLIAIAVTSVGLLILGIAAFVSMPAKASTVYLECQIASPNGSSTVNVDVTLNEGASRVGFTIRETGYTVLDIAADFGPRQVTWQVDHGGLLEAVKERYTVDRTNLAMVEEWSARGRPFEPSRKGTCKLANAVPRKF